MHGTGKFFNCKTSVEETTSLVCSFDSVVLLNANCAEPKFGAYRTERNEQTSTTSDTIRRAADRQTVCSLDVRCDSGAECENGDARHARVDLGTRIS